MQFDKGYLSPYFVDRPGGAWRPSSRTPYILITTQARSRAIEDLLPLLEKVIQAGKPLLIIAEDVDGRGARPPWWSTRSARPSRSPRSRRPASATAARRCCRTSPILTGGEVIAPEVGLKLDQVGLDRLGWAPRAIVVDKDNTTIVDGGGNTTEVAEPGRPDPQGDRGLRLRLGQGEAQRAAGQAVRWRRA